MLVLTRKINEEIFIGNDVRITVVQMQGNRVRLGISAPNSVAVRRSEVAPKTDEPLHARHQAARQLCGTHPR
jgi:carbon storage regulator CsrA